MTWLKRLIVGSVIALCITACSSTERTFLREGAGVSLYSADMAEQAQLQEIYAGNLCREAGLPTTVYGGTLVCNYPEISPGAWSIFVQSGMNDIDGRCDAYLAWLDSRRRSSSVIQQQIIDTQTALGAILISTQAGAQAISIAGAALGYAAHTFTNINSRLLFEIEQSTVQALVLTRQNQFRAALPIRIDNKPAAIYALRSYLRLCMPMTIETQINTTVKLFERGGLDALADSQDAPMIDPRALRSAVITDPTAPIRRQRPAPVVIQPVGRGQFETKLSPRQIRTYRSILGLSCEGGFTEEVRSGILNRLNSLEIKDQNYPGYISRVDDINLRSVPGFIDNCAS